MKDVLLIKALARDGRASFRELAKVTGLAYTSVRERLLRLRERGLIDIKPLISPQLYGSCSAYVRIKTGHKTELIRRMSRCNRVLSVMEVKDGINAILVANSIVEILVALEKLLSLDQGVEEYTIEYGRVPDGFMIPIRNPDPECSNCHLRDRIKCRGCLPIPRVKSRR